jgi:hypothetical protein
MFNFEFGTWKLTLYKTATVISKLNIRNSKSKYHDKLKRIRSMVCNR